MPVTTKKPRKYERDTPVSLAPLSLPEALGALMKVKPDDGDAKEGKRAEKREGGERKGERRAKG